MTLLNSSVLYQISSDDLDKLIASYKAALIDELSRKKTVEKPLTKQEAADYLRIHVTTFDQRFRDNVLPTSLRHINGGTIYFFASELENFLKKTKI